MVKSMTGFGRHETVTESRKISVELRSVNHRYLDLNIKTPRAYNFLEEYARAYLPNIVSRGKLDVYISVESYGEDDKEVRVNAALADSYVKAVRSLADTYGLLDDVSAVRLAQFPDVIQIEKKQEDKEAIWLMVLEVLTVALNGFMAMREREGERITAFLIERAEYILSVVDKIVEKEPQTIAAYSDKLKAKITELIGNTSVDESRLLTEVAIFSDKLCTTEESDRLKSHIEEFKKIIKDNQPAGRKLDFLIQEINREINTIGSKASDIEVSRYVVELKAEIEKLREQIQNIE